MPIPVVTSPVMEIETLEFVPLVAEVIWILPFASFTAIPGGFAIPPGLIALLIALIKSSVVLPVPAAFVKAVLSKDN